MITRFQIRAAAQKVIDQFASQSSMSGIISIALCIGIAAPQAAIYAGGIVALCGFIKIFMDDVPAVKITAIEPTVNVNVDSGGVDETK